MIFFQKIMDFSEINVYKSLDFCPNFDYLTIRQLNIKQENFITMKTIKTYLALLLMIPVSFSTNSFSQDIKTDQNGSQEIYHFDIKGKTLNDFIDPQDNKSIYSTVDPGLIPEGDNINDVCFSQDGSKVFVANGYTNNVTVIDWQKIIVIGNIDVGIYPFDIETSDNYAIVTCIFSNDVYLININTLEVDTVFKTSEQPVRVKISNDNNFAYVACDIENICEVFDLQTLTHTNSFTNLPIALFGGSGFVRFGRGKYYVSNFEITQNGDYLIAIGYQQGLIFMNTQTGLIDYTISNIDNGTLVELSGNSQIVVAAGYDATLSNNIIYQIDVETHSIINSIVLNIWYSSGLAVNYTGTKALVGTLNGATMLRFATSDYIEFNQTGFPKWIENSSDTGYVVTGGYNTSLINYNSESLIAQYDDGSYQTGTTSPNLLRIANAGINATEVVSLYDYSDLNNIVPRGTVLSGAFPEGDAPYRIQIINGGKKAIYNNTISQNIGVVDIRTNTLDTLVEIGINSYEMGVTSNSKWAVLTASSQDLIYIINLETFITEAILPAGDNPFSVTISPDDKYAYVGNLISNTISVVELDGPLSNILAEINTGVIGTIYIRRGIQSAVVPTPSGNYVLVAASFDDMVQVIDTETWSVVSDLSVGDFPLRFAFIDSTNYAVVVNYDSHSYSLLYIDGSNSYVENTFSTGGQNPVDVVYNPEIEEISIINYNSKHYVDVYPLTGVISSYHNLSLYGKPTQIRLDQNNQPVILTFLSNYLITIDSVYQLNGRGSYFDCSKQKNVAAVSIPGPDYISIIEFDAFNMNIKTFLEGPFENSEMNTKLNDGNIPFHQPFDTIPWNYEGNEYITTIPDEDIVDWVMVEIRQTVGDSSTATANKVIDRKAGFLLKNGYIVGLNGTDLIKFNQNISYNLYAVVWHRNHLPIMSANPLILNNNTYEYDFTNDPNKVYGGILAVKELAPNYWGMIGGDANSDGLIDFQDILTIWYGNTGESGYYPSDLNLDIQTDNKDKNDIWLPNVGFSSVIPE
ncbi:MAG: hypothetical protein K8S16_03005 [Bacteroidales bacterium]|nr:hypothetical protein [Bacteroidales bacterium]